jgi:hypothetical protein
MIARQVREHLAEVVPDLRTLGFTDGEIGSYLGVTKQAVQKRFPRSAQSLAADLGQPTGPVTLPPTPEAIRAERATTQVVGG